MRCVNLQGTKMLANDAAMFYCDIVYMCGCWCN